MTARQFFCPGYKLYGATEFLGICYVFEGDVGDTFGFDLLGVNVLSKRQRGKNADLAAGIVTFDIGGRVLFRKTQATKETSVSNCN